MTSRICPNGHTFYGQTAKKGRCPIDGKITRRLQGFSGPAPVQRNARPKEYERAYYQGQVGPCRQHGWACRAMEDHGSRK